jgi:hypothetical protein
MKVAKTAKKSAKGWAGYKVAKGAGKTVKRKARRGPFDAPAGRQDRRRRRHHRRDRDRARQARPPQGRRQGQGRGLGRHRSKDYDDATLAHKVETELFRPADAPKGQVSVNVNDGVVELRGELPDQRQIDELARAPAGSAASRTSATCCTPARTAADHRAE